MSSDSYPGLTQPMIGALLRLASERAHVLLMQRLAEDGFGDLRPAHLAVFQFPGPHGVRPVDLAARTGMTKQALTPLLNDLERLGYLERRRAEDDGRGRVLWLTNRGLAFVAAIKQITMGIEQEWSERLGPERFATVRAALEELVGRTTQAGAISPDHADMD